MKYKTTFQVHGRGRFPVDMLRYDSCFPDSGTDAAGILGEDTRVITLVKYHHTKDPMVTTDRWNSFGWGIYSIRNAVKL